MLSACAIFCGHGRSDHGGRVSAGARYLRCGADRPDQAAQAGLQPGPRLRRRTHHPADQFCDWLRGQPQPTRPGPRDQGTAPKIENGADFALTQPLFEAAHLDTFLARYEAEHGPLTLPLLAGVLPLYNARHAEFLHNEVPGIHIPADIRQRMRDAGEKGAQAGLVMARDLIRQLRPHVQGLYLMPPFDRYDLAAEVIEGIEE
ncbi:MAG: hypothetical protein HC875_23845 [Anaerolineales bacterium]|nr:hypothetical protein [Anaerolineales bacterium]